MRSLYGSPAWEREVLAEWGYVDPRAPGASPEQVADAYRQRWVELRQRLDADGDPEDE